MSSSSEHNFQISKYSDLVYMFILSLRTDERHVGVPAKKFLNLPFEKNVSTCVGIIDVLMMNIEINGRRRGVEDIGGLQQVILVPELMDSLCDVEVARGVCRSYGIDENNAQYISETMKNSLKPKSGIHYSEELWENEQKSWGEMQEEKRIRKENIRREKEERYIRMTEEATILKQEAEEHKEMQRQNALEEFAERNPFAGAVIIKKKQDD